MSFPETDINPNAEFGVRISGDSMEPEYYDGDIIQIEPCNVINSGELGLFILNGDALFKQYINDTENRRVRLHSFNGEYEDRIIKSNEYLHVFGRVVGKLRVSKIKVH